MKMNETLKFSWGHIFAFLAVIFSGYLSFMGLVYLQGGEGFGWAVGGALGICFLLLLLFLSLQRLKATSGKFDRRIVMERTLLFASPILFWILMTPYIHFWRVNSQNREIVTHFRSAISGSRQLFEEYDAYSEARMEAFHTLLDSIVTADQTADFAALNIQKTRPRSMQTALETTLRLQLKPEKYDSLRVSAIQWVDKAGHGNSIWNIFLMGNIRMIKNAVSGWDETLRTISTPVISGETYKDIHTVRPFESGIAAETLSSLETIQPIYKNWSLLPRWIAVVTLILLYGFLLLPYLIQDRNTKSVQGVFSGRKTSSYIDMKPSSRKSETPSDDVDGYGSFKI